MKLYCVTTGNYPFEVWSNSIAAERFVGDYDSNENRYTPDPEYDTVAIILR